MYSCFHQSFCDVCCNGFIMYIIDNINGYLYSNAITVYVCLLLGDILIVFFFALQNCLELLMVVCLHSVVRVPLPSPFH